MPIEVKLAMVVCNITTSAVRIGNREREHAMSNNHTHPRETNAKQLNFKQGGHGDIWRWLMCRPRRRVNIIYIHYPAGAVRAPSCHRFKGFDDPRENVGKRKTASRKAKRTGI